MQADASQAKATFASPENAQAYIQKYGNLYGKPTTYESARQYGFKVLGVSPTTMNSFGQNVVNNLAAAQNYLQQVSTQQNTGGGSGGGGGDSYASALAQTQANFRQALPSALQNIYESAGTKVGGDIRNLQSGITSTLTTAGRSAEDLANQQKQAEMQRIQGLRDILSMTSRGVQSGARMLAGKNAGTSSAVEALQKAYEQLGSRELGKVQQSYQLGQEARNLTGSRIAEDVNTYLNVTLPQARQTLIDNVVEQARAKITDLRSSAVNAQLPDLVNINAEINRIKQDAQNQLAGIDSYVNQEKSKYTGKIGTVEQARAGALGALNVAAATPTPMSGALPIYTRQGA